MDHSTIAAEDDGMADDCADGTSTDESANNDADAENGGDGPASSVSKFSKKATSIEVFQPLQLIMPSVSHHRKVVQQHQSSSMIMDSSSSNDQHRHSVHELQPPINSSPPSGSSAFNSQSAEGVFQPTYHLINQFEGGAAAGGFFGYGVHMGGGQNLLKEYTYNYSQQQQGNVMSVDNMMQLGYMTLGTHYSGAEGGDEAIQMSSGSNLYHQHHQQLLAAVGYCNNGNNCPPNSAAEALLYHPYVAQNEHLIDYQQHQQHALKFEPDQNDVVRSKKTGQKKQQHLKAGLSFLAFIKNI